VQDVRQVSALAVHVHLCFLKAGKCAYAIVIMAVYWLTEVIPMAVTALLPIVIFPWLGVMDTKQACQNYFKVRMYACVCVRVRAVV
jgi:di/tricarboxylate transporter